MPVHAAEDRGRAALKGQMEMRADLGNLRESVSKFRGHDAGLKRPEPEAFDAFDGGGPADQFQKVSAVLNVLPVTRQMDASEHEFPDAALRKSTDLPEHGFGVFRTDAAAGVGDQTVAAEFVAAVLHLQFGAGVLMDLREEFRAVAPDFIDVRVLRKRMVAEPGAERLHKVFLPLVSEHQVHAGLIERRLVGGLRVAACGDDDRFGRQVARPVEHLAGFPVRDVRDRAGVHDVDVRFLRKRHDPGARERGFIFHDLSLVLVDLAAEGMESDP